MHSIQAVPGQTPFVVLHLSHNLTVSKIPEIRFDLASTIGHVKAMIEKRYGSAADQMELILKDLHGNNVCNLGEDDKPLSFYNPQDNYTIHVIDKDPNSMLKGIDDVSKIDKYTISEADYDKLQDNFRKWKANLLENNPELNKQTNPIIIVEDDYLKDIADGIKKGDRCQIIESKHRGTIEYVGKIPNLDPGYYVGVRLDEPYGKHTGKVGTVQYFTCPDKYGLFMRPNKINVGDYPELDLDDFADEEDEL